jgi:phage repressor protein C with HTH and peptisase S24 domain
MKKSARSVLSPARPHGSGTEPLEDRLDTFPQSLLAKKGLAADRLWAIFVLGNAMAPTLHEGALTMFREPSAIVDGELYVVLVDGALYVRRLAALGVGAYTVYADQPGYPHWVISREHRGVDVLGCVVYVATWAR